MCATMVSTMLAGCGSGNGGSASGGDTESEAAESEVVTNTYGDSKGTHLEMWTFVELHAQHYGTMVEQWNKDHQAGTGAPDICDVEVGQFPNVVAGKDKWLVPLDDYMTEYKDSMVPARLDVYSGDDGKIYGAPYHVGATVMYYNVKAMADAMGISNDDTVSI